MNNCHGCNFLEWGYGDVNDPEGFMCNKREYKSDTEEAKHVLKLKSKKYRIRKKRCFVPIAAGIDVVEK